MTQAAPLDTPADLDTLMLTREALDVSEFEVFRMAYAEWYGEKAPPSRLEKQFDDYLSSGALPFYVRHYCRHFVDNHPECIQAAQTSERRSRFAERLATALLVVFVAAALILS